MTMRTPRRFQCLLRALPLLLLSAILYWSTKPAALLHLDSRNPQTSGTPPWTIFYNIYLPMQDEGLPALRIVQEQLEQIEQSFASSFGKVTIYITTIGKPIDHEYFSRNICATNSFLDCRFLGHHETGYEELSLTALHEFCTSTSHHPSHKVIYLHNKGSLHPSKEQSRWRRHLTKAVTSEQCLNHQALPQACDVCGLLALPWPFLHLTGNFFVGKCSYIRKLLSPIEYQQRILNATITAVLRKTTTYQFTTDLLPDAAHHVGIYRFANEQWIGSHPTVRACDLTSQGHSYWTKTETPEEFHLASFPRRGILDGWSFVPNKLLERVLEDKSHRMREYYLLPGNIHRWQHVYGAIPPPTSWVWNWFPDGYDWRTAVQIYGIDAVDRVTMNYAPESTLRCLPPCSEHPLI